MNADFIKDEDNQKHEKGKYLQLPFLVQQREIGHKFHSSTTSSLEKWGEESFLKREHTHMACQIASTAKTTYLLSFSPDGSKVASSHGDHNIYVCEVKTGRCICTLKGHPRSPWCVAFHPSLNDIMASGCLGGEVRVWDLKGGSEMWTPNKKCTTEKKSVIASLAFHPTEQLLVIAAENELYFWDWFRSEPFAKISTASKLEKIKYVEFDPLGYKLITGIAITRAERHQGGGADLASSMADDASTDPSPGGVGGFGENGFESDSRLRNSRSLRAVSSATHRLYRILDRVMRNRTNISPNSNDDSHLEDPVNGSSLDEPFVGVAVQGTTRAPRSVGGRRHHLMPRSSASQPDDEFPPTHRITSEDSASSSSLDSSSSVTSGVSGASNERNTRLSLLWTSRLNRGFVGGSEADTGAGGRGYDLEERRGEGSVMRAGANSDRSDVYRDMSIPYQSGLPSSRNSLHSHLSRDWRSAHASRRYEGRGLARNIRRPVGSPAASANSDEQSGRLEENERNRLPLPARNAAGHGGRWMYYRGKLPSEQGTVPGPSRFGKRVSSRAGRVMGSRSRDSASRIADDPTAGPSGVPSTSNNQSSDASNPLVSDIPSGNASRVQRTRSASLSTVLDPQCGVRLLSRHIEHMQNICRTFFRSLSVPRAHLDLSQLQQIRTMLYDVQHQIRSLRALVNQTMPEELPAVPESLNSASVDPDPDPLTTAELLTSQSGVAEQVEVEVNLGSDSVEQHYNSLNDESVSHAFATEDGADSSGFSEAGLSRQTPPTSAPLQDETLGSSARSRAYDALRNRSRARRANRNRDAWSGIVRRNLQYRRFHQRMGVQSEGESGEGLRPARWRNLREARHDQRRNRMFNRRLERSDLCALCSDEVNNSSSNTNRSNNDEVRSRHSGDWQRRLRSSAALTQQMQSTAAQSEPSSGNSPGRNGERALHPADPFVNEPSNADQGLDLDASSNQDLNDELNDDSAVNFSAAGIHSDLIDDEIGAAQEPYRPASIGDGNASSFLDEVSSNLTVYGEDSLEERPERDTRSGPPTTSLASRINSMLAQRRQARNWDHSNFSANDYGDRLNAGFYPTPTSLSASPRRASEGAGRSPPFPDGHFRSQSGTSGPDSVPADDDMNVRPIYRRLRSLHREIMMNYRNRLLRRDSSATGRELAGATLSAISRLRRSVGSLVTGRDLAGATLSAIGADDLPSHAPPRDRTASFRHMLLMMADQLTQMMEQSFPAEFADMERSRAQGLPPGQTSALRPFNPRLRDFPLRDAPPTSAAEPETAPSAASLPRDSTTLNRHMQNLRLLVQLALHLIYQLLNFICNQTLSYEERPISRLPNPFRDDAGQYSADEAALPPSRDPHQPSSFEMDIEPGLHNLTTLLETVQMASEELRNDAREIGAAAPPDLPSDNDDNRDQPFAGQEPRSRPGGAGGENEPGSGALSGPPVSRRLTDFLARNGIPTLYHFGSRSRPSSDNPPPPPPPPNVTIQRPEPTTAPGTSSTGDHATVVRVSAPRVVINDASSDIGVVAYGSDPVNPSSSLDPQDELAHPHHRSFGGIPLRLLGRQNAVDRRSPELDNLSSASTEPADESDSPAARLDARRGYDRSFFWHSSSRNYPFRAASDAQPTPPMPSSSAAHNNPFSPTGPPEPHHHAVRDQDNNFFFNFGLHNQYFNQYYASRNLGSMFVPYAPGIYNGNYNFYRIQAWDYRNFEIPDVTNSSDSVVVKKCRIHFDASVSISADGTLLAAVLPDSKSVTRIGVHSLETKTLGQLLYASSIGFNIVCVSLSPTMNHLVLGISSHRLGVNHNASQMIGRIYKLCDDPMSLSKSGQSAGVLKFCRSIELASEVRQSSLNCIRWIPVPGQGLVYGTNRGHLFVIR